MSAVLRPKPWSGSHRGPSTKIATPSVHAFVALKEILGQLRPEPEREPLPPRRHYEPPSKGRYKRRG